MEKRLLAVDSDNENFERQKKVWIKYDVELRQSQTMEEAILYLQKMEYIIVGINADCINFMPKLKLMRDITGAVILIMTSNFSLREAISVYEIGADFYTIWWDNIEESTQLGLTLVEHYKKRIWYKRMQTNNLEVNGFTLYPDNRQVFVYGKELFLHEKEFQILKLLLSNPDRIVTYYMIIENVWGAGFCDLSFSVIHSHINRLRQEIYRVTNEKNHIKTIKNIGYQFLTNDKK